MSSIHAAIKPHNLAVITGGASGIGLAAATALCKLGMNIALGDVSSNLDSAVKQVQGSAGKGGKVWAGAVDVGKVQSVEAFRSKVEE